METNPSEVSVEDRLAAAFEKAGYSGAPKEEPDEEPEQSEASESVEDSDSEDTQSDAEAQTDEV